MSEFLSFAERIKDVGATVLILGLGAFFLVKYAPSFFKQQGILEEVISHSSRVIANNNELLRLVMARDGETRDSLERIEKRVDEINLNVHDIRTTQQHQRRD